MKLIALLLLPILFTAACGPGSCRTNADCAANEQCIQLECLVRGAPCDSDEDCLETEWCPLYFGGAALCQPNHE